MKILILLDAIIDWNCIFILLDDFDIVVDDAIVDQ